MLKKFVLFLVLASTLSIGLIPALAAEPALGVFDLARFVPFNVSAFISVSTEDSHIAALDDLRVRTDTLIRDVRLSVDPMDVTGMIDQLLDDSAVKSLEAALAWSGDAFAFASDTTDSGVSQSALIVPLVDRAAAERDILSANPTAARLDPAGRFDIYYVEQQNRYLMIASDLLYITNGLGMTEVQVLAGEDYPRLSGVTEYIEAVSALPEDRYNIGMYLDARRLIETEAALNNATGSTQVKAVLDGTLAVGATILNGDTLTLDAAFVPDEPALPPLSINPEFASHIPSTMGASIHGADLAALINNLLAVASTGSEDDPREVLSGVLGMMGLELDNQLRWLKGDYALYASADLGPALRGLLASPADYSGLPQAFQFGVVIEAVSDEEAQAFTAAIVEMLQISARNADNLRVRDETINGVPVTVASIDAALNGGIVTFDLGIGVSDDVFAFGSLEAVRAVFDGSPGLPFQTAYIDSSRYFLPDATMVWVLDGATAVNVAAFAALPNVVGTMPTSFQVDRLTNRLARFLRYATISAAVTDEGYTVLRATITIGE
jgi:hypothetical protein